MAMTARIIVHHLQHSRSNRILWALEELGVPYTVKVHYRTQGWFAGSTLKDITPLGKSPALVLDDTTLTESAAILTRLLRLFPAPHTEPYPSETALYWSHFAEGSLMLYLQPARFADLGARELLSSAASASAAGEAGVEGMGDERRGVERMNAWFQAWAREHATAALREAEAWLAAHGGFSEDGKLGLGDFMMFFPINSIGYGRAKAGAKRVYELGPATEAWLERVRARPAWVRSYERMREEEEAQRPPKL